MGIAEALRTIQEKIQNSAVKAGRDSDNIRLIAVSKTVDLQGIIEAVAAGVAILGENRVQEAKEKIKNYNLQTCLPAGKVTNSRVEWHLIGNLQKNKVKTAVQLFDLIHSVDSEVLTEELEKHARKTGKKQRVLVQVKLSDEESKHGVSEDNLTGLLEKICSTGNLKFEGLMTIPPFFKDPEKSRPYFIRLRQLADKFSARGFPINELSMGMSNDFEIAIEEGATMVRIGTAIFGERSH